MVFEDLITTLSAFWQSQGCFIGQPYDVEVGAGTFHPFTFFRVLGPASWRTAYVQPSRRPTDGRYASNPLRTQAYFQLQVIVKPSPPDIQQIYLRSLEAAGISVRRHDVRFVEDDWESPTLGAGGLGWEVWLDSLEITQFTYFQQMAGIELNPVSCEITYGLERIAMYLQGKPDLFELVWSNGNGNGELLYGNLFKEREIQYCTYHFEQADPALQQKLFELYEREAKRLLEKSLYLPAYDYVLKTSHSFNLLDASGSLSTTERQALIGRIRGLAKGCADQYLRQHAELSAVSQQPKADSRKLKAES
ncbi:MAG: glycine--tRNA ligase subunit alpha [Candidatus Omnitrophica bacterium]|nr:glycine--tRNA ligase subunit alpha [Candidatus Omnitrophota bacterium]